MDRTFPKAKKTGSSWSAILGVALSAFALGALMVGYWTWDGSASVADNTSASQPAALTSDSSGAAATSQSAAEPSPTPTAQQQAEAVEETTEAVERVQEQQGGLDQRLAAAEQRLARLDLQTQAAAGNAARAEGLLIAFAARRSLERGAELGYLADQLRLRFSDALPNAVNTVINTSRDPITLDQLLARLEGLAPKLADATEEPSFERFKRELGSLFVIRRESTPSPRPELRLERARLFMESGRVERAIEEVQNLPGADTPEAKSWMADAKRYAAAQHALDLIETSAVLEPRRLRDRQGQPVEQPSPAEDAGN